MPHKDRSVNQQIGLELPVRLEAGRTYTAVPRDEKLGPPQTCTVLAVDELRGLYRTQGPRQVAAVILFGCEQFWRPIGATASR